MVYNFEIMNVELFSLKHAESAMPNYSFAIHRRHFHLLSEKILQNLRFHSSFLIYTSNNIYSLTFTLLKTVSVFWHSKIVLLHFPQYQYINTLLYINNLKPFDLSAVSIFDVFKIQHSTKFAIKKIRI